MAHYTEQELRAAAQVDSPGLFNPRNNDPKFDEARQNALARLARTLQSLGHTIQGYEVDPQSATEEPGSE